jgi:hypothetical protein
MCVFRYSTEIDIFGINEKKYFQSCHTPRAITRAGFDSAPLSSTQTGCSSITKYGPPLNAVGAAHTTHPGLLLTYNKTRALKRSCALSKEGALSPIFEEDMPP